MLVILFLLQDLSFPGKSEGLDGLKEAGEGWAND
jgi:hypothetical protein